jgi:hypothetical protein
MSKLINEQGVAIDLLTKMTLSLATGQGDFQLEMLANIENDRLAQSH